MSLLLALSHAALAAPLSGVLWGAVETTGSARLPGAAVTLTGGDLDAPTYQRADSQGRYLFVGLEPGEYDLEVSHAPYDTTTTSHLTVSAGVYNRTTVEMTLTGLEIQLSNPWGRSSGATLTLSSPFVDEPITHHVDSTGALTIHQLTPGVYTMRVDPDAWELLPKTVTVTVVKGVVEEVAVALEQRPIREDELRGYGMGGGGYGVGGGGFGAKGSGSISNIAGEDYTWWGTNGFVETLTDRFSTFAVDVDTASYAIARRKLRGGYLPPPSSVRVEEFINAHRYDYVGPTGEAGGDPAPFAVNMEAAPSPFSPDHHILRIGVQGWTPPPSERGTVHLTFLVDTSGSMSSADKMDLLQQSLHHLVENLKPDDTVALATYAGSVTKVLGPTSAREAAVIHAAIEDLRAGGSTAMNSGIELAYQMASEARVHGDENRVIVLSDGDANVGPSSHGEILETIRQYTEEGITLSTVGFGMGNYKDTMMEQLANKGDGNYVYIDTINEARKVFGSNLESTLVTIARDVKIQVEFDPDEVERYRLLGYENRMIRDEDFRDDAVDAGEIGSGHQVTALYEVQLIDRRGRKNNLATVRLRSKPPGPDAPAVEWETRFPSRLLHWEYPEASMDFQRAVAVAAFAEVLRESEYAEDVTYLTLWGLVDNARRRDSLGDLELLELVIRADLIDQGVW